MHGVLESQWWVSQGPKILTVQTGIESDEANQVNIIDLVFQNLDEQYFSNNAAEKQYI